MGNQHRTATIETAAPTTVVPAARLGWRQTFSSLAIPDFRMLWLGLLLSMAAVQIDTVARPWLAYEISGSGLTLGAVALARGLPMLLLSPIGGTAADRFDKRKVLIATQVALGAIGLANALLVHLGIVQVWHLAVLGALQGMIFPFNFPARQAYVPEVAGPKQLSNALALTSSGMNLNRVLGPALAGVLLAWNPAAAFYATAALYGLGALTLLSLPSRGTPPPKGGGAVAEVATGLRYIWEQPILRMLIAMAFVAVFLGMPFQQLLPIFQADVLRVGPAELGIMFMGAGIGSLLGSLVIARFAEHRHRELLPTVLGLGFGLSLIAFSLSGRFELSVALLVLVGLTGQGYMTINGVLLMLHTDRKLYGRVNGIYLMTWSLMPVAMLPIGALTDLAGAPAALAASGLLLTAVIAAAGLRETRNGRHSDAPPPSASRG